MGPGHVCGYVNNDTMSYRGRRPPILHVCVKELRVKGPMSSGVEAMEWRVCNKWCEVQSRGDGSQHGVEAFIDSLPGLSSACHSAWETGCSSYVDDPSQGACYLDGGRLLRHGIG